MKTPGGRMIQPPGVFLGDRCLPRRPLLDHAEHDGAYKGEGNIRGKDTQLTDESHGNAPLVNVAARNNA
jgi:hypothetical protein